MKRTDEQQDFITAAKKLDGDSIVVQARAGTGKTTLANELFKEDKRNSIYLVFSKEMAEAQKKKVPYQVKVSTAHAASYGICAKGFGTKMRVDYKKYGNILKNLEGFDTKNLNSKDRQSRYDLLSKSKKFIDMIMANLVDVNDSAALSQLVTDYGIEFKDDEEEQMVIEVIPRVFDEALEQAETGCITFSEMPYYAVTQDFRFPKYELILVDEAQDFNKCMKEFARKLKGDESFVAIGDDRQSIMGFAGAMTDSMDQIISTFGAKVMPLTTNFRCGKKIIKNAQEIVPDIKAWENAIEGEVAMINEIDFDAKKLEDGAMCLCRFNAPLISPAMALLKVGRKATIKGRDLKSGLVTMHSNILRHFQPTSLEFYKAASLDAREQEVEALQQRANPSQTQIMMAEDRWETLKIIADNSVSVESIPKTIEELFSENNEGVLFSSAHRSKGLEAENVYILGANNIRMSREGMTAQDHLQEANLDYVARTRAMKKLTKIMS